MNERSSVVMRCMNMRLNASMRVNLYVAGISNTRTNVFVMSTASQHAMHNEGGGG